MRPADLKPSTSWRDRKTLIEDSIFYAPDLSPDTDYIFPGWVHAQTFKSNQPVCVEFCSGNGDWIASKAEKHPDHNWVAVEMQFDRVRKIWSKLKNRLLANLFIVCAEGKRVSQNFFPANSVDHVYVNFPDPWPKKRHWKHRIIQHDFVKEINRILKPGGTLTLVTDDEGYSEWMIKIMLRAEEFTSVLEAPHYVIDYPDYGSSFFEGLWREQGKTIRYHIFKKSGLNG